MGPFLPPPDSARPPLKPPPLEKGDTVGLIAPASALEESLVRRAVENLRESGYGVKLSHGYRNPRGYLAASDAVRVGELHGFFADPDVRAIICLRGGYGSPRILDRIDYDLVRRNPKILVGYSDITALLNSIQRHTHLVVFHGPMAKELAVGLSPFTAKYFREAFRPQRRLRADWGTGALQKKRLRTIAPGSAEGILIGGNLSVLASTLGTPYEPRTRGAILFLEDVNERPFRIDRMLNQLRLSGKLSEVRGVLLGAFTGCNPLSRASSLSLQEVFQDYFGDLQVPVLSGFAAGHVPEQVTLPFGIRVRLDATGKTLTLLESPVREAKAGDEGRTSKVKR